MKHGWDLDRPIREIVISEPTLGPVHVLKADVIDGFYRIGWCTMDDPKLELVFPSELEDEEIV